MENLEEMRKFLEKYNLPKLNQEEIENMNRPITSMEVETAVQNLPTNTSSRPDVFTSKFYQKFIKELTPILLNLPENCRGRKTPKLILQGHRHPDTKTRQRCHKKENYRPMSLMSIDVKFNNILPNRIKQYIIKRVIHYDQVGFIPGTQGFFSTCKSINVIHHINKMKDKNHIIISIDTEKAFEKIQYPFMTKKKKLSRK